MHSDQKSSWNEIASLWSLTRNSPLISKAASPLEFEIAKTRRKLDASNMSAKYVTVLARVKAKPGKEAAVHRELLSLVEPSRKDDGCINYDLHQSKDNPALFMFHENWTCREHLDSHLAKPDLQSTLARLGPFVAEPPEITFWERIS